MMNLFKLNDKVSIFIFKQKRNTPELNIATRLDLLVYDIKNNLIDGLNICLAGNGDLHSYSKNFYIKNGIIYLKHFYTYDSESSSSEVSKFQILQSGYIVPYFINEDDYNKNKENGKIKNNTKEGTWIETKSNRFVKDNTYLKADYNEGKPIGKWEYYNLIDENLKGDKLLMTEEYSKDGKLIKREIVQ